MYIVHPDILNNGENIRMESTDCFVWVYDIYTHAYKNLIKFQTYIDANKNAIKFQY